jgi:hypothetical protein
MSSARQMNALTNNATCASQQCLNNAAWQADPSNTAGPELLRNAPVHELWNYDYVHAIDCPFCAHMNGDVRKAVHHCADDQIYPWKLQGILS